MAHARKALRDQVKALLTAGLTSVENVGGVRGHGWNRSDLPAVEVSTPALTDDRVSDDFTIERQVALDIIIKVAHAGDVEDALDEIAEEVEPFIFGLSSDWQVNAASSEFEYGDEGANIPAQLVMRFNLAGYAEWSAPQSVN